MSKKVVYPILGGLLTCAILLTASWAYTSLFNGAIKGTESQSSLNHIEKSIRLLLYEKMVNDKELPSPGKSAEARQRKIRILDNVFFGDHNNYIAVYYKNPSFRGYGLFGWIVTYERKDLVVYDVMKDQLISPTSVPSDEALVSFMNQYKPYLGVRINIIQTMIRFSVIVLIGMIFLLFKRKKRHC